MDIFRLSVESADGFASLKDEWNALLSNSRSRSIFLTWEWVHTWWKHFSTPSRELRLVCARDKDGVLKGILPLYQDISGGLSKRNGTLRFLGAEETASDYLNLIVDPEKEEDVVKILLTYAIKNWNSSILKLTDITMGSKVLKFIVSFLDEVNANYRIEDAHICPILELPDTVEGLYKKLKPNMRSNYKYLQNKYKKNFGAISMKKIDYLDIESEYETLFRLHGARFTQKGAASSFLAENIRNFHLDIGKSFRDQGWVRFYSLENSGEVLGTLYCFSYHDKLSYFQSGINPEYEHLSIGLILLGQTMEDAIRQGIKEFDFLRGPETYKWHWTDRYKKTINITIYPKTPAGSIVHRADILHNSITSKFKSWAGKRNDKNLEGKILIDDTGDKS